MLSGLFFYDIFWVFGTDVMVTVAKSFDAPIKLIFPQDFLENGIYGTQYAMLGLGDIVIPGVYIALLLRFDVSLNRPGKHLYFYVGFIAYIVGLLITMGVLIYFKHAQPALLYLVPCCLLLPFSVALIKGDFTSMMRYSSRFEELSCSYFTFLLDTKRTHQRKTAMSNPKRKWKTRKKNSTKMIFNHFAFGFNYTNKNLIRFPFDTLQIFIFQKQLSLPIHDFN